jgi:hypothetical protein
MGFIFPGVALLARWSGSARTGELASCSAFSFEQAGGALLLLALTSVAWPLAFRRLDSALYAMTWAFPLAAAIGLWFYLVGLGVAVCRPLPFRGELLSAINATGLASIAAAFWFFFRPRLGRVVDSNPQKWDFATMKYSLLAPVFPLDSSRDFGFRKLFLIVATFVVSQAILDRILSRYMPLFDAHEWELVMLAILLSYGTLFLALSEAYVMWIVRQKCRAVGRKMTIREFSL